MDETFQTLIELWEDVKTFFFELSRFVLKGFHISFLKAEERKGTIVNALYRQRGRLSQRLTHTGMGALAALGVMMAPIISQEFPGTSVNPWAGTSGGMVLSASTQDPGLDTQISSKVRDSIISYTVQDGDTVSSIAEKFNVSVDTIRWQNTLSNDKVKAGSTIGILPVTGIAHKVVKGDTVYSIAKKYDSDPQAIADFPFNTFANDETFELAIGQTVIVPDGVKPADIPIAPRIRQSTPDAGSVVASGQFVWPTAGTITQRFSWYHPAADIANRGLPAVLAADSGKVISAGWSSAGYGNNIVIDHGNGYKTLYAHLSKIYVIAGQTVGRGSPIGQMGSTGKSTGPHLHFEIFQNGVHVNPLGFLK